jgi:hypothetical protein
MNPLERRGMFYLAAAVSDFFLPDDRVVSHRNQISWRFCRVQSADTSFQAEHKIQSTHGSLILEMDQVPKVLRPLVQDWTPEGYIVSFKVSKYSPESTPSGINVLTHPPARDRRQPPHPEGTRRARAVRAPASDRQRAAQAQDRGGLRRAHATR